MSSENEGSHLDSHADMVVCGKHCYILSCFGINATVSANANDLCTMQIPSMDAVVTYNCLIQTKFDW